MGQWRERVVILGPQPILRKQDHVGAPFRAEASKIVKRNPRSHIKRYIFETGTIDQDQRTHDGRTIGVLFRLDQKTLLTIAIDKLIAEYSKSVPYP